MVNKNKKLSKIDIEKKIKLTFSNNPTPKEIKSIKRLAMSRNIKLGDYKKKFCKKCYIYYTANNSEIRIKNSLKIIKCKTCGNVSRFKIS